MPWVSPPVPSRPVKPIWCIAGGVESMSRAPFVMPKADSAFSRANAVYDTTIGWRFVNPQMKQRYGTDSMPETAENVAAEYGVSRADQDAFAMRSQARALAAQKNGRLAKEIVPVTIPAKKGEAVVVDKDEHPRETSMEALGKLKAIVKPDGTVTAGNASGVNDGACALILANERAAKKHGLTPLARVMGVATAGCAPRIMGIGPVPATHKLLARLGVKLDQMDVIELNEAFAAQGLAVLRELGVKRRRSACEPERRRHCARTSARHERGAAGGDSGSRNAGTQTALCPDDHVHRCRTGDRGADRARLNSNEERPP